MWSQWLLTDWTAALMTVLSTVIIYLAIILLTRIFGLRSFSKMSSFDFAMTIALGTLFGSTIVSPSPTVLQALVALTVLFAGQKLIAALRHNHIIERGIDNEPILLMSEGEMLRDNMRATSVTEDDIRAKLREANVISLAQVKAVVFETTGDISVLHTDSNVTLDPELLTHVRKTLDS